MNVMFRPALGQGTDHGSKEPPEKEFVSESLQIGAFTELHDAAFDSTGECPWSHRPN